MIWQTDDAAAGWQAGAARREAGLAGVTDALLSLARVRPGMRVLDCGCGSGELALVLHDAVSPGGSVVAVDHSAPMVDLARRAAAGRAGLEFAVADLQRLDLAGFDAAVSRMVLMLVPDEGAALERMRAALRPGGRLACSVWAQGENPRFTFPADVYRSLGHEVPASSSAGMVLRLGSEPLLRERLERAGFHDVLVLRMRADRTYAGVEEVCAEARRHPGTLELFEPLDPDEREEAWRRLDARFAALATPSGVRVVGEQVIAVGTA